MGSVTQWVNLICRTQSHNAFNPYTDTCELHDLVGASRSRRETLLRMITMAASLEIDAIWLGRDLGYRGGRRTGLALTDDFHVEEHLKRWNLPNSALSLTNSRIKERTASVVWDLLSDIPRHIFLWNVFPLHPHEPNDPFSNRAHNSNERKAGEEILRGLIELLQPRRIVGIGRDAALSARRVAGTRSVVEVRHPSYGGIREFQAGISDLYGLRPKVQQSLELA